LRVGAVRFSVVSAEPDGSYRVRVTLAR
jgi:hypothetical protein